MLENAYKVTAANLLRNPDDPEHLTGFDHADRERRADPRSSCISGPCSGFGA
jgi:hypothetical protein